MGRYTYAIFDIDDTILDLQGSDQARLEKLLKPFFGEQLSEAIEIYHQVNDDAWVQIVAGADRRAQLSQRFPKMFAYFNQPLPDGRDLEAEYLQALRTTYIFLDHADEVLHRLPIDVVKIGISNGNQDVNAPRLTHTGLDEQFDHVFYAEEMGTLKPDPKFYQTIYDYYPKMQKDHTIIIGDQLESDVQGANQEGLDCIWYNPQNLKNDTSYQPTYVVQNLNEIQAIIGIKN